MAYSIGNISGCHINPAVSLGLFLSKKLSATDFIGYLVAQFVGGIVGAAILVFIFGSNKALGTNGFGEASALHISAGVAFVVEIILTFVFVTAILGVTSKAENAPTTGLVHILGIPFTGTSVNPARSFGPALLSGVGSVAFSQV